eukprot:363631-Chlamydomonas_euryale.AAC.12
MEGDVDGRWIETRTRQVAIACLPLLALGQALRSLPAVAEALRMPTRIEGRAPSQAFSNTREAIGGAAPGQ